MRIYNTILTILAGDKMKHELELEKAINDRKFDDKLIKDLLSKITSNEAMVNKWVALMGPKEENNEDGK